MAGVKLDLVAQTQRHSRLACWISFLWLLVAAAGCSDNAKFDLAPVSGRITVDGKPAAGVNVVFMPTARSTDHEAGCYSKGKTDEAGEFSLETVEPMSRIGAVVASHRVIITEFGTDTDPSRKSSIPAKGGSPRVAIPWPYFDYQSSTLEFTVEPGGTDHADFALKSKDAT